MSDSYYIDKQDKQKEKIQERMGSFPIYIQEYFRSRAQSLEPSTRLGYMDDLAAFLGYLKTNPIWKSYDVKDLPIEAVARLMPNDIEEFLDYLSLYKDGDLIRRNTAKTKSRKLATLCSFYNFLIKRSYEYKPDDESNETTRILLNPASLADKPKIHKKEIITLSQSAQESIIETVTEGTNLPQRVAQLHGRSQYRDTAILYVLLGTGIRVSELVGLNIDDVNQKEQKLYVTRKGGDADYVYYNDEVAGALLDYLTLERDTYKPNEASEKALFLTRQHGRITVRNVEYLIKKYANAALGAGNKITPHKMRSTFATNAVNKSGDIFAVSKAMGHSSINTTSKYYTKSSDEAKKKISQIDIG